MQENQQRWDLTSLFSHFEGEDYKKALKEFEEGCCLLQKFVDNKPSEGNFSSWLKMYLDVDNKVGALFESLNAYVYSVYSTQTTDSKALNEIARLDEKSLAYNKTALAFRGIISQFSNLLDSFYESYPHFKDYDYVLREEIQLCAHQMSVAEENLAQDMQRYGGDAWSRLHEQIISNLQDAETGKSFNELRNEAYAEEREIRKKAYEKELSLLRSEER
ncbi:MAG: peptidase M3, partial [Spirochaetaceae bacterium]|nr:peptidase M3 [Spirochaetaceae bacterium]